jgi:long-chain fatty acid transport protein
MALIISLFAQPAWAGGIMIYEVSTQEVGLAAAGTAARAQDATTLFTNPSGMTRLQRPELMVSLQAAYGYTKFNPNANTGPQTGGDGGNGAGWLPGGSLFYVHPLSSDFAFGVGTLTYFGGVVDYRDTWAGRYFVQSSTLLGVTIMPSIAFRVNEWLSLGAGLNAMYGMYENEVAINNIAVDYDGRLKIKDTEWGYGGDFGALVSLNDTTRLGITYFTKVDLDFSDTPKFYDLGPGLTAILDSRGLLTASLDLSMSVPETFMLSLYHELNEQFALLANVGWQDWSSFGEVGITVNSETPTSLTVDQNYEDTWHVALGGQYRLESDTLLSCGIAYDSSMVKDRNRTPDLPVGETWRFGLGSQFGLEDNVRFGLAYAFMWSGDLRMDQSGPLSGRLAGKYRNASYHFFSTNVRWLF